MRLSQLVLSVLSLSWWNELPFEPDHDAPGSAKLDHAPHTPFKSIAIVGAGSAGIAVLKTILELPEEVRADWKVVLYEQRHDVGGVWLPDLSEPHPPKLPETPLYPLLHVNTPHPTMTYPGFPFRPNTPLFPSHEYMWQYHADIAERLNLTQHIHLNSQVYAVGWRGNSTHGKWEVDVHHSQAKEEEGRKTARKEFFDHLIVAAGHNHYPRTPDFDGTDEWLANSSEGRPKRELIHSIFYREPEHYRNQTVLVVGAGASGRDAASQVRLTAAKTYHSFEEGRNPVPVDPLPNVDYVGLISHFTKDAVVLQNGTTLTAIDSVIFATGYQFLLPFLSRSPSPDIPVALTVSPSTNYTSDTAPSLQTNTRYIYPLHQHIFSLSPTHPPAALAFVGLPVLIANCPSDIAQSMLIAHTIANASVLPERKELLSQLLEREESLRQRGYDPYIAGHKMVGGDDDAQDYQNELVRFLKRGGTIPDDGKDYVEPWRRLARKDNFLIKRGWTRIEEAGPEEVEKWLDGVETEEQWADLLFRLWRWQKKYEEKEGVCVDDLRWRDLHYWEAEY